MSWGKALPWPETAERDCSDHPRGRQTPVLPGVGQRVKTRSQGWVMVLDQSRPPAYKNSSRSPVVLHVALTCAHAARSPSFYRD